VSPRTTGEFATSTTGLDNRSWLWGFHGCTSPGQSGRPVTICFCHFQPVRVQLTSAFGAHSEVRADVNSAWSPAFALLLRKLLTFRRWDDETPYAGRFFLAFCTLLVELALENFCIFAVSATDLRKYQNGAGRTRRWIHTVSSC
jgi:hypothetical protein